MKFDESQALILIKQNNLPSGIIKVWKFRDIIPDKFSEGLKTPIVNTNELLHLENLNKALNTGKLNISSLCRLTGNSVTHGVVNDWKRGKGLLKQEDLIALKKAINSIRISFSKVLAEFEKNANSEIGIKLFKAIILKDEIVWMAFFDRDHMVYQKIGGWKRDRRSFPADDIDFIKSMILVFLTETAI